MAVRGWWLRSLDNRNINILEFGYMGAMGAGACLSIIARRKRNKKWFEQEQ